MKYLTLTYIIFSVFLFSSCFQEDDIIERQKIPEGIKIGNAAMTSNYRYQLYYDLESNKVLKSNHIKDWDLGFDCSDTAHVIILNYAMMGAVYNTGDTDFVSITAIPSINDKGWKWDPYDGDLSDVAMKNWYSKDKTTIKSDKQVYIYNRGIDENGNNRGYIKFQLLAYENNNYVVRFSDMNNTEEFMVKIPKITDRLFHYLSFDGNGFTLDLEPDKHSWDLLFSRYREALVTDDGSDTLQYTVVGAYLNRYKTKALQIDSSADFSHLTATLLDDYPLQSRINVIGHEWKKYDIDQALYTIVANRYYIIHSPEDRYYKLQFLSYFNDLGERGYPKFEFQRIK